VSRRLILVGATAIAVGAPFLAAPLAAAADSTGSALISLDGTSFSRAPQGSIFSGAVVLVPGSTTTGTFYVKNDSDRAADLRIAVAGASSSSTTLLDELTVEAATPSTPEGTPVPLSPDSACISLLSGQVLGSQDITTVRITLTMDAEAGNPDQGAAAAADLLVSLTDPAAPESAEYDCTEGGGIPLIPAPSPSPDVPVSETTEPVAPIDVDQPTEAAEPDGHDTTPTGGGAPAAETPPTAGAIPSSESGIPIPWLGTGALVLGAAAYLAMRFRRRSAG
jgi:hypothetical protein